MPNSRPDPPSSQKREDQIELSKKSFRGLVWGTRFSEISDEMIYIGTGPGYGGIDSYYKKNDKMTIGAARVDRIEYDFWRGIFCSVEIGVSGFHIGIA